MPDDRGCERKLLSEHTAQGAQSGSGLQGCELQVDPEGCMHIHGLTVRPSNLCSREFTEYYIKSIATEDSRDFRWPVPARTAARAEWDRFDAWVDAKYNSDLLTLARQRYAVELSAATVAGVQVGIITPGEGIRPRNDRRVLINLHGGGFFYNRGLVTGQLESIPVAAIAGIKVLTLDYRQAPHFRHPAGSEDVEAVYMELLKDYAPESIGIYGCSAGAALAAQSITRFAHLRVPRPGAIGMFSMAPPPPFGHSAPYGPGWGDSGLWFAGIPKNEPSEQERILCEMLNWYMEGCELDDVTAYPGSSDAVLEQFPPTLLLSGTRDFAASTVIAAHARFLKLGVDAALYLMEGAPHAAHVYAIGTPEAHDAHVYVARWLDQHLSC